MKKIYIAGPMTTIPFFNFPSFDRWRGRYEEIGYEVFSPADHDRELLGKSLSWTPSVEDSTANWKSWNIPDAPSLRRMLGDDLAWIAAEATHMFMLKGWENSRGAKAEHALAVALDLTIIYEN